MNLRFTIVPALIFAAAAHAQTIQVSKDNKTIAITATDTAEALADTAEVSIGYQQFGTMQDATYAAASKTSNAVMDALKAAGVAPGQIESQQQNLSPIGPEDKVRYGQGLRFLASQSWKVTCKAADAANILHLAITAGANSSGDINWTLADESALDGQAAQKAITHAQQIAERMATGLHTQLGPLIYASNQVQQRSPVMMMQRAMAASPKASPRPLALSPDKVTRSATVYAVFAIQ